MVTVSSLFSLDIPALTHDYCLFSCLIRVVYSGTKNKFNMPVMLSFWGREENKSAVLESMARHGYKLNTGGSRLTGTHTHKCTISISKT